jgi:hypothetical protein
MRWIIADTPDLYRPRKAWSGARWCYQSRVLQGAGLTALQCCPNWGIEARWGRATGPVRRSTPPCAQTSGTRPYQTTWRPVDQTRLANRIKTTGPPKRQRPLPSSSGHLICGDPNQLPSIPIRRVFWLRFVTLLSRHDIPDALRRMKDCLGGGALASWTNLHGSSSLFEFQR